VVFKVDNIIFRNGNIKTRYAYDITTNTFNNTRIPSVKATLINGILGVFSGGLIDNSIRDITPFLKYPKHVNDTLSAIANEYNSKGHSGYILIRDALLPILKAFPELTRPENLSSFNAIVDLTYAAMRYGGKPITLLTYSIFPLLKTYPHLVSKEYSMVLRTFLHTGRTIQEFCIDPSTFFQVGLGQFLKNNPLYTKDKNMTVLPKLTQIVTRSVHIGSDPATSMMVIEKFRELFPNYSFSDLVDLYSRFSDKGFDPNKFFDEFNAQMARQPELENPDSKPMVKMLFHIAVNAVDKGSDPLAYIELFKEILAADPEILKTNDTAKMKGLFELAVKYDHPRSEKHRIALIPSLCVLISSNPDIIRSDHIANVKKYCEMLNSHSPITNDLTSIPLAIRTLIRNNPSLALLENAEQLNSFIKILSEMDTMKFRDRDITWETHEIYTLFGPEGGDLIKKFLVPLISANPEVSKIENIIVLKTLIEKANSAVLSGLDQESVYYLYKHILLKQLSKDPFLLQKTSPNPYLDLIDSYSRIAAKTLKNNINAVKMLDYLIGPYLTTKRRIKKPEYVKHLDFLMKASDLFDKTSSMQAKIFTEASLLFDDYPEYTGIESLLKEISSMEVLLDAGIFPTYHLCALLSKGESTIEALQTRLRSLKQKTNITLEDQKTDYHLYYSILHQRLKNSNSVPGYDRYDALINQLLLWQENNRSGSSLENPIPAFSISGKGTVAIQDDEFDGSLIDSFTGNVLKTMNEHNSLCSALLNDKAFSAEERCAFRNKVLSYLILAEAKRSGRLPANVKMNSASIKSHIDRHPEIFSNEPQKMDEYLAAFGKVAVIEAVYFNALALLTDAKNKKELDKARYIAQMIYSIILNYGFSDEQLKASLVNGTCQEKLESIVQAFVDRKRHLADIAPIPKEAEDIIEKDYSSLEAEIKKLGLATEKANVQEYLISPATIEALFRGYIGKDCSKSGNIPIWAYNPNNLYMIIKKGEQSKGYIGLTRCVAENGDKYILIDTMQPCPIGIIKPILKTLSQLVKNMGYKGLAIGCDLEGSFNYKDVVQHINGMPEYYDGELIELAPEDRESWDHYEKMLGKDHYHALNLNHMFKVLEL
jgi:hypothetical protein